MAIRREIIEAMLRIKDQGRFKSGMKSAARSVRDFGHEGSQAAAEHELLVQVLQQLQREVIETRVFMKSLARAENEAGNEAVQMAAKQKLAKSALGGLNIPLKKQLTSWSFWKDRLSLTRGEIMSTVITIGAYLAPALIALGSSATAAMFGGGLVGAGGIAALITGIGGLGLIAIQAGGQIKKVKTAQDAYNLAVEQYGKGSKEAARASAHLYAVIQTQGGRPVWEAVKAIQKLKDTWTATTGSSRRDIFGILTSGIGNLQRLLPTFARETNLNTGAARGGLSEMFRSLSGNEMKQNIKSLSFSFRQMFGPLTRGGTNVILVTFRYLRKAAPWAVKVADAFERWTMGLRRSSSDQDHVKSVVADLVSHFKAWWGLAKALGGTLRLIFRGSKEEGKGLVITLTGLVLQFNHWLDGLERSGKLAGAFHTYIQSLTSIVWAVQHPVMAINRWLPVLIDTIAVALAHAGPHAAALFINTFMNLGPWGKFLTVAFLLTKFGVFRILGRLVAGMFIATFAPTMAGAFATRGAIGVGMIAAGGALGTAFAVAFVAGATVLIGLGLAKILIDFTNSKTWQNILHTLHVPSAGGGPAPGPTKIIAAARQGATGGSAKSLNPFDHQTHPMHHRVPYVHIKRRKPLNRQGKDIPLHGLGGTILPGQMGVVGDMGPEIAIASPHGGTIIHPLMRGAASLPVANLAQPSIDTAGIQAPIHVHLEIDGREIARAQFNYDESRKSRRGGRAG